MNLARSKWVIDTNGALAPAGGEPVSIDDAVITNNFDPVFAQSEVIRDYADTLDGKFTATSGDGSVSLGNQRYNLSTGATASSTAELVQQARQTLGFGRDLKLAARLTVEDATEIVRFSLGRTDSETSEQVGFIWEGGALKGLAADGGTASKTTLDASPTTGALAFIDVYLHFTTGSKVEFWVDKDPNTNSADGEVTSNLPTTDTQDNVWGAYVENINGDFDIEIAKVVVGVAP